MYEHNINFVGIDIGRKETKLVKEDKTITFPSKVGEGRDLNLENNSDYYITIDNKQYFVGDLADESYSCREMATESKIHQETKILFLTALSLVWNKNKTVITTGVPVNQHTPKIKEELTQLLKGTYTISNKYDNYSINVKEINIIPEGAGAFWDTVINYKGQIVNENLMTNIVRIIDIGSRTINYLTIRNGKYLDRDSGTLNYGCFELENKDNNPNNFTRRIIADLSQKWHKLNDTDIIFIAGGGAIIMEQYFKESFKNIIISDNPVISNARGYRKLGMIKYGQTS